MQHGQIEKSVAQPSGAATPEEADARHRRASAFSGCSFGGDFAGSTKPHCGQGREGPCFGVWAVVCDPLSKAECVPAFARESKRGAFVGEVEKRKRNGWGIKFMAVALPNFLPLLTVGVHREPGNVCI